MGNKIITLFIRGGANVGDERVINTPDGKIVGEVVKDLSADGEQRILTGGKVINTHENYYDVLLGDEPIGKAVR